MTLRNCIFIFIAYTAPLCALDIFEQDLDYIRQTLTENHPGFNNPLDPSFPNQLEENYHTAKHALALTHDDEDKKKIVRKFGQSFHDSHLWIKYEPSAPLPVAQYRIEALTDDIYWIHIPSFYPSSESQQQDLQYIVHILPTLRDHTVIFDLRGNRGGACSWSTKLIESYFGKTYADQRFFELYRHCYISWRASAGNLKHMKESMLPSLRKLFGEDHCSVRRTENTYHQMQEAFLHGRPYYVGPPYNQGAFSLPLAVNLVRKPLFVIVDRNCYSATLMFIDELKGMETDVILIGEVTGADSMYMELRKVSLPSGKGTLGFPMNVYIGPSRGHNIPYYPDIHYTGDLQDTTELQKFVISTCAGTL